VSSDPSDRPHGAILPEDRFRVVVVPHLGDALALARWLTGSRHDAEDVVQEACIRALAGLAAYEGRGAKAWLLAIVRNTAFTWLAKNRPKEVVSVGTLADVDDVTVSEGNLPADTPETSLIARAAAAEVEAAIAAVPQPFREVLVLRDVNGLSYKEIAGMVGAPIGTVMSRLARGRALFAVRLGQAF
jgi:RNA polymerase sigma factor (sigma-70 family)